MIFSSKENTLGTLMFRDDDISKIHLTSQDYISNVPKFNKSSIYTPNQANGKNVDEY